MKHPERISRILGALTALLLLAAPVLARPAEAAQRIIVLDPGHGGKDSGALGRSGLREKQITLDVAMRTRALLSRDPGFEVFLTRTGDTFVSLYNRRDRTLRWNADLFMSIHCDYYQDRSVRGTSVFVLSEKGKNWTVDDAFSDPRMLDRIFERTSVPRDEIMRRVNETVRRSTWLGHFVLQSLDQRFSLRTPTVKRAAFAVLKNVSVPSVLVEVGFVTNPEEEYNLMKTSYRQHIAEALAEAIEQYLRSPS